MISYLRNHTFSFSILLSIALHAGVSVTLLLLAYFQTAPDTLTIDATRGPARVLSINTRFAANQSYHSQAEPGLHREQSPATDANSGNAHVDSQAAAGLIAERVSQLKRTLSYPPTAVAMRLSDSLRVEIEVLPDGTVATVRVLDASRYAVFNRSAVREIAAWQFPPPGITVRHITRINYIMK
ncbi:MAG: TonB family protein [Leptospiraceae bacterium]|nr:TonB family protein [Leptospiraceae bacterium]MCB1317177.1 TonB family protein [Leptospiraceae bacterium]